MHISQSARAGGPGGSLYSSSIELLEPRYLLATVVYRVNSGGGAVGGTPGWTADTTAAPSPYTNSAATIANSSQSSIDLTHPSVPAGTPATLFQTERWDPAGGENMLWNFPVTPGLYQVNLYFAETFAGTSAVGKRKFDVSVEGAVVLDDYDVFADVGANKGVVKSVQVTSDNTLNIAFGHVVENPSVKAIEIVSLGSAASQLGVSTSTVAFGNTAVNTSKTQSVTLTNLGSAGQPSIVVDATSISGTNAANFSDSFNDAANVTLGPGQSTTINVTFLPTTSGSKTASLSVIHSGSNSPQVIALSGTSGTAAAIGFGKSVLPKGFFHPTSLTFGPDGKLYVAQQDGTLLVVTVARNGANSYSVTSSQAISLIHDMVNRNDDGLVNASITGRLVTGLTVVGTAANPVIYVASSDPRIGAGPEGTDTDLDTNSGILSRLTWNGSSWVKLDLVRGLPRSEENHTSNGVWLNAATNTLYIAQGGNTNMGAPSNNFAYLPESALSGAILSVNLNAIGNTTYDLPTLNDENRPGTNDSNDPFGGDDGRNQAKLVPGGPVQIYSPGYRNPYDLVVTQAGRMYTIDNGANAGWGGPPIVVNGKVTNQISEPGVTNKDNLQFVSGPGYYGGHPNPTRANMGNTFNASNPQSPVTVENPAEAVYSVPQLGTGALAVFPTSTNGLAEYTASNFGGAMKGNLLAAVYYGGNAIQRLVLNAAGNAVVLQENLFSTVGFAPLDVTAVGDNGNFPGTVWVADYDQGKIFVYEPNDYGNGGSNPLPGLDDPNFDSDGDHYLNGDEDQNHTNKASAADVPPDWDVDFTSDLLDANDDNDALPDTSDPFALDANNGRGTNVPVSYQWENNGSSGGLLGLGFTGLMSNGTSNYASLYDPFGLTAGGAAGVLTVDAVSDGTALGSTNTQQYGFQFGVNVTSASGSFVVHTRILAPFAGLTPQAGQEMGFYFGTGNQSNYVKLVVSGDNGGSVKVAKEIAGTVTNVGSSNLAMSGVNYIDLYLTVAPAAGTVQASFTVTRAGATTAQANVGTATTIPPSWFSAATAPAVGIISTSAGPAPAFAATWDFLEVQPVAAPPAQTPFSGTPQDVTTTIQAENFDNGGQGIAYSDNDPANIPGKYRSTGVDIQTVNDPQGGGFHVGYTQGGEWLEYTVNVPTTGMYSLDIRFATNTSGGAIHFDFNNINKSGPINLPGTGGWTNWQTINKSGLNLSAGVQVVRLSFDSGVAGDIGNFNWFKLTPQQSSGLTSAATAQQPMFIAREEKASLMSQFNFA